MLKDGVSAPLDNTVEVDETYVGGKWANMSKKKRAMMAEAGKDNKIPVMGLVERNGNAKLTVIGKRTFKEVVRQHVSLNAFINTDQHLGYWGLNTEFADHDMVDHGRGEYRRNDVHTNTVEGFFSLFKRMVLGTYHQISPKHLQRYCDELTYRYNSRKVKDCERFIQSLKKVEGRLTYNQLINK
jgi:ISXO2-like transposase domain